MGKKIYVDHTVSKELAQMFKVEYSTVWRALNYKMESGLARTIRAAALQRGGTKIGFGRELPVVSDVVTIYEDGQMVMYWDESVRVVFDLSGESDGAYIEARGIVVEDFAQVRLSDIPMIQERARKVMIGG